MSDQHQACGMQHYSEVTPKCVITLFMSMTAFMYASVAASWAARCSSDAPWGKRPGGLGGTSSPVNVSKSPLVWENAWNLVLQTGYSSDRPEKQSHFKLLLLLSISWTFPTPICFSNYTDLYSIKLQLLSVPSWDSFASQEFVRVKCNSRTLLKTLYHSQSHRELLRFRQPEVSTTTNAKE